MDGMDYTYNELLSVIPLELKERLEKLSKEEVYKIFFDISWNSKLNYNSFLNILSNNKECEIEKKEYVRPDIVEKGNRDTSLFEYINQLYYKTKLNKEEILLLAYNFNQSVCSPPLSDSVVEYKVNKIFKKERTKFILIYIGENGKESEEDNEV